MSKTYNNNSLFFITINTNRCFVDKEYHEYLVRDVIERSISNLQINKNVKNRIIQVDDERYINYEDIPNVEEDMEYAFEV